MPPFLESDDLTVGDLAGMSIEEMERAICLWECKHPKRDYVREWLIARDAANEIYSV